MWRLSRARRERGKGRGREGKGREGKGREGKGRKGKGRKGKEGKGKKREGRGRKGSKREITIVIVCCLSRYIRKHLSLRCTTTFMCQDGWGVKGISMIMLLLLLLLPLSLSLRIPSILPLLQQLETDKFSEVQPHLADHDRVPGSLAQAIVPLRGAVPHAAQLSPQQRVELVQPLLCPLDATAHHYRRETLLVRFDGVADQCEIDVGELVDVMG